jgi:hypothetical protein
MKLDPGMHIGMHLVFFGKAGVTPRRGAYTALSSANTGKGSPRCAEEKRRGRLLLRGVVYSTLHLPADAVPGRRGCRGGKTGRAPGLCIDPPGWEEAANPCGRVDPCRSSSHRALC